VADRDAPTTNTFRVQDELREAILTGSLPPGSRLRAEPLAERLRTSRTPVREALILLAREGLVDIEPRRGAVVRSFDAADLLDLYDVRALIEPYAARRAATRIDDASLERLRELCTLAEARGAADDAAVEDQVALNEEFHRIIIDAAQSPRLEAAMRAVAGIPRAFRTAFWHDDAQREQSLFCHRQLVDALAGRRPRFAEAVMRMHIVGATEFLTEVIHDDADAG
jgi:DNA-binding GntR family transcriptional regulator